MIGRGIRPGRATAVIGLVAVIAASLMSCASTGAAADFPLATESSSFGGSGLSDFARENLGSFSTFTLSNGLPVVVKKSSANRVRDIP